MGREFSRVFSRAQKSNLGHTPWAGYPSLQRDEHEGTHRVECTDTRVGQPRGPYQKNGRSNLYLSEHFTIDRRKGHHEHRKHRNQAEEPAQPTAFLLTSLWGRVGTPTPMQTPGLGFSSKAVTPCWGRGRQRQVPKACWPASLAHQ